MIVFAHSEGTIGADHLTVWMILASYSNDGALCDVKKDDHQAYLG